MAYIQETLFTPEEDERILKVEPDFIPGTRKHVGPFGYVVSSRFDVEAVKNLNVRQDDIFVVTPAKCGTTWMQEIVWLMNNDVDVEEAKKVGQFYRFPFLEVGFALAKEEEDEYPAEDAEKNFENVRAFMKFSYEYVEKMESPRFIKTHAPLCMLPDGILEKCKVVFVARNVKDATVSFYHHWALRFEDEGLDFKKFSDLCMNKMHTYTPMIPMILEAWNARNHPNLHFTTYEALKADLHGELEKLQKFFNLNLSPEKLEMLKNHVSIDNLRHTDSVNKKYEVKNVEGNKNFIRKGMVGDWKNYFDDDLNKEWDKYIEESLGDSDYKMIFE